MQNSMLVSSVFCFFPTWLLLNHWTDDGNGALWIALLSFLLARGATLWLYFYHLTRSNQLLD